MSVDLVEEEDRENSLHAIKSPLKPLEQSRTVLTQSQKDNQVSHEYTISIGYMYIIFMAHLLTSGVLWEYCGRDFAF